MAIFANLSLKNSAAVAVVYFPKRLINGAKALWVDRTSGKISLQGVASLEQVESQTIRKTIGKVTYMEEINATTGEFVTHIGKYEIVSPLKGTETGRLEIQSRLEALVASQPVKDATRHGEMPN
jgi:hypothetical protein